MPRGMPKLAAKKDGKKAILELYDDIGPWWLGMIDAKTVSRALKDAGEDVEEIEVRINSLGGSVFEGLAIHNILRQHTAKVVVRIDGLAASIASVIACAGDVVEMPASAMIMVHNPWTIAVGEKKDMEKAAELLGTCKASCIETYARKTGKDAETLGRWMDEETWLNAADAKAAGFADVVLDAAEVKAAFDPQTLKDRFRRAPLDVAALLKPVDAGEEEDSMSTANTAQTPPADGGAATPPANNGAAKPPANNGQAAAATFTQEDLDNARKEAAQKAVADEAKRQADIRALCKEAGMEDRADHFCSDSKFTVADVREDLFNQLCKRNKPPAENGDGGATGNDKKDDPYADYRKEFAANKAALAKVGVTSEDEFIASRCKDDGKEPPAKKAA